MKINSTRLFLPILLCGLFLFSGTAFGQDKYTLKGYIKDGANGEDLAGAKVIVAALGTGTYSNEYGFYSLTLPAGQHEIIFRSLSYTDDTVMVDLTKDVDLTVELRSASVEMTEIKITAEGEKENVTSLEMSTNSMDLKMVKKLPAFLGEVDVIRTIQLLPGVQNVGDGITGYYVRGGETSQNLILLDEATVYNASHVLGFFSVFNSDALKDDYKLYKGGIPAQYGGRLASVLDLRMKEGNNKEFHGSGGIGLISSRFALEGPIVKDKSSFIVTGRRTYADVFTAFASNPDVRDSRAYFYDVNAKVNYQFSDKDRLFLSGYFGRDVFKFQDDFANDWGNATGTLRWNHLFNKKLFANTTLVVSDFFYGFDITLFSGDKSTYESQIRDYNFSTDFNWYLNPKNRLRFGYDGILHEIQPGVFSPVDENTFIQTVSVDKDYALENGLYIQNEQTINNRLSLAYGLRWSFFTNVGPGTEFTYLADGETIFDSTTYNRGELINTYSGPEPRFAARYQLDGNSSLKLSYNRMRQYMHLASNTTASFPWDIWVPSSVHIPPQVVDQVAIGYFRNFFEKENALETSIELYYKEQDNVIDFKPGADLILNSNIETEFLYGDGRSWGAEFLIRKKYGRFSGWIGYTLSWTERQVPGIRNGEWYPAGNDRRHDISVVALYQLTQRWSLSGTWVYFTGRATTFPQATYDLFGHTNFQYGPRNGDRLPDYHRLDLAATLDPKPLAEGQTRKFESSWNFSLYNAYGRKNVFALDFRLEEDENQQEQLNAYKIYLFTFVPSVTWNFNF